MANNDSSSYTLRFNEDSGLLEYAVGNSWVPIPVGGAGVSSINTLTGAVILSAGANITLTPSGNTITIAASGGGSVTPNHASDFTTDAGSNNNTNTYVASGPIVSIAAQSITNVIQFTVSTQYQLTPNADSHNMTMDATILQDGTVDIASDRPLGYVSWDNLVDNSPCSPTELSFTTTFTPGDTSVHTYQLAVRENAGNIGGSGFVICPASAFAYSIMTAVELIS